MVWTLLISKVTARYPIKSVVAPLRKHHQSAKKRRRSCTGQGEVFLKMEESETAPPPCWTETFLRFFSGSALEVLLPLRQSCGTFWHFRLQTSRWGHLAQNRWRTTQREQLLAMHPAVNQRCILRNSGSRGPERKQVKRKPLAGVKRRRPLPSHPSAYRTQ